MTYAHPCITVVLRDFDDCIAPATHGPLCEDCFNRVDRAIPRETQLRTALQGVDRAITAEPGNSVAGPRLPLSAIRLDLDEIASYRPGWYLGATGLVETESGGSAQAVRYARAVHRADLAHPTVAAVQKLHRLRCPTCRRLTAVVRPPDWYGADTTITCIALACGWIATNPEALDIVAEIENRGRLDDADLIMLELRARRTAEKNARAARTESKKESAA